LTIKFRQGKTCFFVLNLCRFLNCQRTNLSPPRTGVGFMSSRRRRKNWWS